MEASSWSAVGQRNSLRWSIALVLSCGLILGYFVLRTFVVPLPRQYQLDFGDAKWIEPPTFSPIAYFRKEIFLSVAPDQAWLEIAATDNFKLLVNGKTVSGETATKTRIAQIYDIKKRLKPGTNVIAVSISRTSYPGSAQLLVRGSVTEPGGKPISIVSDERWRVTPKMGIVEGFEDWSSTRVEEELWPTAQPATIIEHPVRLSWVDLNPLLLQLPLSGSWIMGQSGARQATFSSSITAEATRQETWIQIAGSGPLDLLVNGHLVTGSETSVAGGHKLPNLPDSISTPSENESPGRPNGPASSMTPTEATPPPVSYTTSPSHTPAPMASPSSTASPRPSPSSPNTNTSSPQANPSISSTPPPLPPQKVTLEAYDISYWIKKGPNSIVATVRSPNAPACLFASGFLFRGKDVTQAFGTDSSWQVTEQLPGQTATNETAVQIGRNGSAPWGYLGQDLARPIDRSGFYSAAKTCAVILAVAIATLALWLMASALVANAKGEVLRRVLFRDALFHAPVAVGLLFLLLPDYDHRFPNNWSFQPKFVIGAILVLAVVRIFHFFTVDRIRSRSAAKISEIRQALSGPAVPYLVLAVIMGLGFGLRYHNLGFVSFDHDEMGVITKSHGIFKLGFPYTIYAGQIRPLTTYEAVPYPLALFGLIFGYSEWSIRLPACLMGTLCIGIMGLMGRRLFDWRTGLIAALVYACLPLNIRWAGNAFYLQQCQFMAMLTFWFFYEATNVRPLHRKYLTATAVFFCLTYLSWEGSAFLVPALFIGLLVVRWGEWWWLKEFHLYRCLFFMSAVVIAQYCSRTYASYPYLTVGSGLSQVSGPSLFFLTPAYQPTFYVDKLLLSENHVFFTVMVSLGLLFCWGNRGFRYVVAILITLFICHTNFLAALSPRYCYYFQPLLVLGGIAAAVLLYDRLRSLAWYEGDSTIAQNFARVTGLVLIALLFVQSNESVLKEYALSSRGDEPGMMTRLSTYRYDYRGAAQFVKSQFQPGDLIAPGIPHVIKYYSGKQGDYFLDTLLGSKVAYNQLLPEPRFVDKFGGLPAIRNLKELLEMTHRGRRTWLIFAPYSSFERLSSPDVIEYLDRNSKVLYESYRVKVLLVQGAPEPAVARSP